MLCEKLGVKIASQSIIDEITMKCQKLLKKTPLYTQMANTEDNRKRNILKFLKNIIFFSLISFPNQDFLRKLC